MLKFVRSLQIRVRDLHASVQFPFGGPFQPQLAFAENQCSSVSRKPATGISFQDLLSGLWHMGVPKSKVSPSRKRMKHQRFIPDKVAWVKCEKCGEPKKRHRICTDHIDVCALTTEQWLKVKAGKSFADEISS